MRGMCSTSIQPPSRMIESSCIRPPVSLNVSKVLNHPSIRSASHVCSHPTCSNVSRSNSPPIPVSVSLSWSPPTKDCVSAKLNHPTWKMHQRIQFTQLKIVDHGAKATQCWLVYQGRLFIHQVCVYRNTEITQGRIVYQQG